MTWPSWTLSRNYYARRRTAGAAGMDNWTQAITTHLQLLLDPGSPQHLVAKAVHALGSAISGPYAVMVTPFGTMASQRALRRLHCHAAAGALSGGSLLSSSGSGIYRNPAGWCTDQPLPVQRFRPTNSVQVRNLFHFFEQFDLVSGAE